MCARHEFQKEQARLYLREFLQPAAIRVLAVLLCRIDAFRVRPTLGPQLLRRTQASRTNTRVHKQVGVRMRAVVLVQPQLPHPSCEKRTSEQT